MTPVLSCESLSVRYGGVHALTEVSLALEARRVHGLIGPNGAGKSTLIDALSGRRRATGRVLLDGADLSALDAVARRRAGLARSFQRTSVFPALTVGEQLALASRTDPHRGGTVAEVLGLSRLAGVPAAALGYGEQRRLDVALALAGPVRALLLDEPAAGLTRDESLALAAHVRTLALEFDVAVLLIEHDMEVVFGFCDEVFVLELGRLLASGPPDAVRADPRVRAAYLGSAA